MDLQLSDISKYRSEFMGLATIGILVCHAVGNHVAIPFPIDKLMCLGMMGNSIFFMMSGFGLYYSFSNRSGNLMLWYKKRFIRILIPYLLYVVVQIAVHLYEGYDDWNAYWLSASLIGYYIDNSSPWFLSVILLLYLLTPFMIKVITYGDRVLRNSLLFVIILTLFSFIKTSNYTINAIINIFAYAVPFVMGILLGYYSKRQMKMNVYSFICAGVFYCFAFTVRRNFGYFYLGCFLCILPLLLLFFDKCHNDFKTLRWFGTISLESYLTNNFTLVGLLPWASLPEILSYGNYLPYTLVIIVGLTWAWIIHIISSKILNWF